MNEKQRMTRLSLLVLALGICALIVHAAIPLPEPVTVTKTVDKWYIETIVIETDGKFLKITCPIGTGDGENFKATQSPVEIYIRDGEPVLDADGQPVLDADGKPTVRNRYSELMGALALCKNEAGQSAYDVLFGGLVQAAAASGKLVPKAE